MLVNWLYSSLNQLIGRTPDLYSIIVDPSLNGKVVRDMDSYNAETNLNTDKISVIVPVYNVELYLARCVNSVLAQSYINIEVILVDDGSTDRSGYLCDLMAKDDKRINVIHKQNGGLSSARNAGIEHCTGSYVTFIDSDDWVSPLYLEALYKLLTSYDASFAACGLLKTNVSKQSLQVKVDTSRIKCYSASQYLDIYLRKNGNRTIHYAWGKLYKRALLKNDQFPVGILNEDVESMFKVLLKSKTIIETDEPLYYYYQNPQSITGASFGENYLSLTDVWKRIAFLAKQEGGDALNYLEDINYNIDRTYFTILIDSIIHGNKCTDLYYASQIKNNLSKLRRVLRRLVGGNMRIDRKIACLLIASGYYPLRRLYRITHN